MEKHYIKTIKFEDVLIEFYHKNVKSIHIKTCPYDKIIFIYGSHSLMPNYKSSEIIEKYKVKLKVEATKLSKIMNDGILFSPQTQTINDAINNSRYYIWGKPYKLHINAIIGTTIINVSGDSLYINYDPDKDKLNKIIMDWSKKMLCQKAYPILDSWCKLMGLNNVKLSAEPLNDALGRCCLDENIIKIDPILTEFPEGCLQHVIVHELAHFFVPDHRKKFYKLLTYWLPDWGRWKLIGCGNNLVQIGHRFFRYCPHTLSGLCERRIE